LFAWFRPIQPTLGGALETCKKTCKGNRTNPLSMPPKANLEKFGIPNLFCVFHIVDPINKRECKFQIWAITPPQAPWKVLTPTTPKHSNQGNTLAYVKPLGLNKKINYHLCQVMGIGTLKK
jgi:hypothetical protein